MKKDIITAEDFFFVALIFVVVFFLIGLSIGEPEEKPTMFNFGEAPIEVKLERRIEDLESFANDLMKNLPDKERCRLQYEYPTINDFKSVDILRDYSPVWHEKCDKYLEKVEEHYKIY